MNKKLGNFKEKVVSFWKKTKTQTSSGFDKVWNFCKKYWYLFASTAVLILTVVIFRNSEVSQKLYGKLLGKYNDLADRKNDELNHVNDIRNDQIEKNNQIEQKYQEVVMQINDNRDKKLDEISEEQQKMIKSIIVENENDPVKMAAQINNYFGIKVQQPVTEEEEETVRMKK